jgi:hypothetical protein
MCRHTPRVHSPFKPYSSVSFLLAQASDVVASGLQFSLPPREIVEWRAAPRALNSSGRLPKRCSRRIGTFVPKRRARPGGHPWPKTRGWSAVDSEVDPHP